MTVSVPGFKKFTQEGVRVQVAQTARIDVVLQVGSTSENITVTADASLLKTEDAAQSDTITGNRINALPLNFALGAGAIRNPLSFVALAPGSSISGWNDIKVNGAPSNTFRIIFEGQDTTSGLNPRVSDESQPSVEMIQEFTLQTSNFAAEFGQVSGGLFNFTSRSGTNSFHGSAYGYLTNEAFNAGRPFTDDGSGNLIRPRQRKVDFGGSVGGPVWIPKVYNGHDRTFFFFNYEMYRDRQRQAGTFITVPTNAMRTGDFSGILTGRALGTDPLGRTIFENTIYDPLTSRTVNGQVLRDPFPSNRIPTNRFDPVAVRLQSYFPAPVNSNLVNNFEQVYNFRKIQAIPSVKIDHNFTPTQRISGYYSQQRTDKDNGVDGLPDPISTRRDQLIRSYTTRINYDNTITPTLVLHMGIGYQRYHNPDTAPDSITSFNSVSQLGLTGAAGLGFPTIYGLGSTFGGFTANSALGPTNRNLYLQDKPTAVASVTKVKGSHSYKFGSEWRLDNFTNINAFGVGGVYTFAGTQTTLPSTQGQALGGAAIGFPYASFLLGAVDTASVSNEQNPQYRKQGWAIFAQDTWKATRKLTLDYGLRYDYQPAPHELHYRTSQFSPTVINPSAGNLPGGTLYAGYGPGRCNCGITDTYPFAFGPRFGAAYQLDEKTVLRGGWGITYGQAPNFNYIGGGSSLGMGFNTVAFSTASYGDAALRLQNGLSYNPAALYAASYDPGIRPLPNQINTPPQLVHRSGGRPGRTSQWNISIQRELTRDMVVEAAYVGNRGAWFQNNGLVDINALTPERIAAAGLDINSAADRALLTSRLDSPQAVARGFTAPYASYNLGNTVAQRLRPFPQFGYLGSTWAPLGNTWYDSLQVKFTKRFSHGLNFTANYTRSKNLTTVEDQDGATIPVNDVFNRKLNKTLSRNDQPNIFVVGFNYQSPTVRKNLFTRLLLSDWTVGGILRYSSGFPIQVPFAQNNLNALLFRGTFANRVPGEPLFLKDLNCGCIDPNKDFVLNPKAWTDPAAGQFGTSAAYYNDYRYARRPDEQLSFGKQFRIRESMTLQFRAEFFNVFNRTYLNNPSFNNAGATQARNANGVVTAGFGRIDAGSTFGPPRSGQIVARFQF